MKKLIKRLFIFLIPVAIFIGLWEYGLSQIQNTYSLKRAQLETQAPSIEVLVLGPSLALRGVNPDYFSMKGYNAANIEQPLFYDTRIALKYLDKMTSLKVVLICIAYPSLWSDLYGSPEGFRDYFYADYWGIRYPKIHWYDPHIYSKILQYGNDKAWKFTLKGFKVNLTRGYYNNGWALKDGDEDIIIDSNAYKIIMKYERSHSNESFNRNVDDIKNLLKELNSRKISAIFYSPPVTLTISKYMKEERWKIIDSVLTDMCNTYHCKWYDYHNDYRFTNIDFRDVWHLNETGATKFSKIINEEILEKYGTPSLIRDSLRK
jgi:hypothetical protein